MASRTMYDLTKLFYSVVTIREYTCFAFTQLSLIFTVPKGGVISFTLDDYKLTHNTAEALKIEICAKII